MKKRILMVTSFLLGSIVGAMGILLVKNKDNNKWKELADKHLAIMLLFNQWLILKQEGKSILSYFYCHNIKTIAIYGMSYVGRSLYRELENSDVIVKYAIDKKASQMNSEINIISPDEELPEVDIIIVTSIYYFNEIYNYLDSKTDIPVVSFEDVLFEL